MGALAAKDARALLPVWGVAAVATVVGEAVLPRYGAVIYALSASSLAAHSIGHEYARRTLPSLMAQPLHRAAIYGVKLTVLAVALATLALVAAVGWPAVLQFEISRGLVILLPPLAALSFTPWLTMVSRNPLAATLLTGTPGAITLLGAQWIAFERYGRTAAADDLVRTIWFSVMAVLAPAAFVLGWRALWRLEVLEGPGLAWHFPRPFAGRDRRRRSPLWHLVAKELRLQQMTFVTTALFLAGLGWALVQVARDVVDVQVVTVLAVIYFGALGLVIGSVVSAEERQLGTLESELMLPVPRWQPWVVKIIVAMTLSLSLGVALPSGVLAVVDYADQLPPIASQVLLVALATAIGTYVSSLSTSGVVALTIAPTASLAFLFVWMGDVLESPYVVQRQLLPLDARIVVTVLVVALLWFAYRNHQSIERNPRRVVPQVASMLLILGAATVLS
jgi:hypothetical protein